MLEFKDDKYQVKGIGDPALNVSDEAQMNSV